jgi:Kdo2-lipid IVA lauroyltransferase/acyltransferase
MIDKNRIEFLLFRTAQKAFGLMGIKITRRAALFVGTLMFYLIPIRKKVAIENLSKAFPQKTKKEILGLARKNYQNITITFFELMSLPSIPINVLKEQLEFNGLNDFKNQTKDERGLIILLGHFGNWELAIACIAMILGKTLSVLVKPQRNPYITDWLKETRARFGAKIIESGVSVKELFKALKNGEAVGIAADQRGHFDNPRFNFFNQPTALYTGTASIALRTNSKVIMGIPVRQKDFKYKYYFEELNFENLPEEEELKVKELTQRYISFIEKYVRQYPEQYFWMHKIWKY